MTLKYIEIETVSRHLNLSLVFREGVKVGDRNFGVVNTEKVLNDVLSLLHNSWYNANINKGH